MLLPVVILLIALFHLTPAQALAQTRHALVIGIDAYDYVESLQKARNDARAVHGALEAAGFEADLMLDSDGMALLQGLERFASRIQPGDEAVFFFAGHGVELDGENILLPADIPAPQTGGDLLVRRFGIPVAAVLEQIQRRGARLSLLILDACRDNPFPRQGTRSLGGTRGLAEMRAPEGAYIMYSAGTGQAALDRLSNNDPDPNSVFTRALLPRLSTPGLRLRDMVLEVRSEVRQLASTVGHNQFPAVYDQLDGEFQFVPVAVVPEPSSGPAKDHCATAATVWASVEATDSIAALESFEQIYGEACQVFAALAGDRLTALRAAVTADPQEPEAAETDPDWTRATYTTLSGHTDWLSSAAFSPDGTRVVTASRNSTARVWDVASGRVITTLGEHRGWLSSAEFSLDGGRILIAGGHTAWVWDAATGRLITTLEGHTRYVEDAAFSPNGRRIITASGDKTARIWDAATGDMIKTLSGHEDRVGSAGFSPDGARVVTGSYDRTARIWDTATGRMIATLTGHEDRVRSAAFSPDGARIVTASGNRTVRVWDAATGRAITTLQGHGGGHTEGHRGIVLSAAFSPDGGQIVTGSYDGTARVWDAVTGREIATLSGHTHPVSSAAFSPDGGRIMTASRDTTARIWTAP